jgi:nicotinamidase-related amidase
MTDQTRAASWRENLRALPAVPFVDVPLELASCGLVIVDMQRYWIEPDGPVGRLMKDQYPDEFSYFYGRLKDVVLPNLTKVLQLFRERTLPVIHVISGTTRSDGRDLLPLLRRRFASDTRTSGEFHVLRIGSEWHSIVDELAPERNETVINKTSRSAFNSTGIDQLLRNLGVRHVVVAGVATNGCVDLTARDAADRGYETFLLEDGCATYTEAAHVLVLQTFQQLFGAVVTTDALDHTSDSDGSASVNRPRGARAND